MKKLFKWIVIIFIGLIIIGVIFGDDSAEQETTVVQSTEENTVNQVANTTPEQTEIKQEEIQVEEAEGLSRPQKNAVRSAEQYINMTGFSRDGLIEQLSSDAGSGYEITDATVAVDSLNIDWNEQAVRSAEQYLDMTGFSCDGLIEQLSSSAGSKYTVDEATYGAQQAGACS
ncbi:Ltp family lipoprotein [Psychrobacter sp. M13]|uniref:Ltp family lipoprotein n=1 Tax=Psychrobacter sp. M13 TaxID=3067275 RepID=UPI00273B7A49|nr:Ltp family lipoprotein [Psychrobacter sp. M13]WLP94564.1 Ltp family lipoprotein [Psychrobacter sp. M13]